MKNVTLTVIDCDCPPTVSLAAHCLAGTGAIAASIV